MSTLIDLTGQRFGKWLVISRGSIGKAKHPKWLCRCDCGTEAEILGGALRGGHSTQCIICANKQRGVNKIKDLSNRVFNSWQVLELDKFSIGHGGARWICRCKCGEIKSILGSSLLSGGSSRCRTCFYQRSGPWDYILRHLEEGAIKRNLSIEITIEDLKTLYQVQDGKCALTGQILQLGVKGDMFLNTKKWSSENTVSVDRINSLKGYTKDNIQLVHKNINLMKLDFTQDEFITLCKQVAAKFS